MAIIGNAYIVVHAVTANFKQEVGQELAKWNKDFAAAGEDAASSFDSGFKKASKSASQFNEEAIQAYQQFSQLVSVGYQLGPAISVAVGAISNLISGLFAMGAQIASAIPAMFALVGAFAALGQAMLVAKLAFGGVMQAYKQLSKGGSGASKSAKQVENAEKNLARVLEQNREALTRANERLADAEERLTEARKEAAEWLQQLNFDAEDAALAEKRAVLALEDARLSLMRVQDLPPNSRARQEAELAYAEADLNLRRAIDRNQDLATETDDANKKGVEGSKQVVDATKAVQQAIDDKAKTERDALRSLIDAQNALNDARKGGGGGGGADALKKLSAEAKHFVEYLISIKDKTQALKVAAGKYLFPQLEQSLDNIINKLFPAFQPILEATGKALGKSALEFSNVVTEASNLEKFERVGKNNTYVIGNLGKVVGNLYDSFLSLMDAADPLIRRFTDWVVALTDGWRESLNTKNATGELTDMFNKAGDAAAQIGDILHNLWDGIMNLGKAASGPGSGGQQLMDTFQGATERFKEFTDGILKDGSAEQFFRDVADNFTQIAGLIKDLGGAFFSLGDENGIGGTAGKLREAVPDIKEMLEVFIEAAPSLADTVKNAIDLARVFTESGSIKAFFSTLTVTLKILNAAFGNKTSKAILDTIAPIIGVSHAFFSIYRKGKLAKEVLVGAWETKKKIINGLKNLPQMMGKIGPALQGFGAGVKAAFAANPVMMWMLVIVAVIAIFVLLYKKVKWFRDFVNAVWGGIKAAFKAAFDFIKDHWQLLLVILTGPIGAAIAIVVKFKDQIWKAIKWVIDWIRDHWQLLLAILTGPIGMAVGLIVKYKDDIWNAIKFVWNWITDHWGSIKDVLMAPFTAVKNVVIGVKDAIVGAFKAAFNFIADIWNNTVGKLKFTIPDWVPIIGGKSFSVRQIPKFGGGDEGPNGAGGSSIKYMASGGIVGSPTLAMIGEAGKEAVIPLTRPLRALQVMQAAGLTGLARAAAVTSAVGARNGNAQPFNINVYPSQGMDEVELASLVGRQVALQLRKGTL